MNFQAIATAYDSSTSESDQDVALGIVAPIDAPSNGGEKKVIQARVNEHKRVGTGYIKDRNPEPRRTSTPLTGPPRPPPPPDELFGAIETSKKPLPRESEHLPQPVPKRRKIEDRSEPVAARILLPRQVQTKTPNVPTEDLQSYGISSKTDRDRQPR